ncbi:MAG: AraC family transcriptional regulator [Tildeniella torsiva UHER 1998/13D]|jgi:AraC-like DNA-binding protein|nr:AraC family transcriptional regulator [Tildeniella torsiva UHER 1998/13D]
MPITLSQHDFWSLVKQPADSGPDNRQVESDQGEQVWAYPQQFGQGYFREIRLRPGLHLEISDIQHHTPVLVECGDRPHPVEIHFDICDDGPSSASTTGQYWLYSSGFAPAKQICHNPHPRNLSLSLHIEPALVHTLLGETATAALPGLGPLLKPADQPYISQGCRTSPAMTMVLQQILTCPFAGPIRQLFLEGKALELIALTLQAAMPSQPAASHRLKPDDIDRIHQAKDILLQDLAHPPSLIGLARQVGLNDCTLKRGFRTVFNTTVFGYLQAQRLDQARLLLLDGQLNVQQAASAVGYHSRSHFTAGFRQRFGVSPRELLAQNNSLVGTSYSR